MYVRHKPIHLDNLWDHLYGDLFESHKEVKIVERFIDTMKRYDITILILSLEDNDPWYMGHSLTD